MINNYGIVRVGNKYTLKNKQTGEVLDTVFDDISTNPFASEEVTAVKLNGKWTFFNANTGKVCSQWFDEVNDFSFAEWRKAKVGNKYTYFNPSTDSYCGQWFDDALEGVSDDGWAGVKVGKKWTYFNVETGKFCNRTFDSKVKTASEGWGAVRVDGKYTYYNPSTDHLCEKTFARTRLVRGGYGIVEIGGRFTYYSPSQDKLCRKTFLNADYLEDGLGGVDIGGRLTFYNPENEYTLQARMDFDSDLGDALRQYPEDFAFLPTELFKNQHLVKELLIEIARGLEWQCSKKGSSRELENYALKIRNLIADKIKQEKLNLGEYTSAKEESKVEKIASSIENMWENTDEKEKE